MPSPLTGRETKAVEQRKAGKHQGPWVLVCGPKPTLGVIAAPAGAGGGWSVGLPVCRARCSHVPHTRPPPRPDRVSRAWLRSCLLTQDHPVPWLPRNCPPCPRLPAGRGRLPEDHARPLGPPRQWSLLAGSGSRCCSAPKLPVRSGVCKSSREDSGGSCRWAAPQDGQGR